MEAKLFESELKVMEVLWELGDQPAGNIASTLLSRIGWNRNTTYTIIKKLIAKNIIERREPGFLCVALVSKEQVRQHEAKELIGRLFDGSAELFLSAFLSGKELSQSEIERLKQLVDTLK